MTGSVDVVDLWPGQAGRVSARTGTSSVSSVGAVDDIEPLARNRHSQTWFATHAHALAAKEGPVSAPPVPQRPVAFPLAGRELRADLLEWEDLDLQGLNDTGGPTIPIGDDTDGVCSAASDRLGQTGSCNASPPRS